MPEKDEAAKAAPGAAETKAIMSIPTGGVPAGLELYLDINKMNQLYKVADMFAKSDIVPKAFQQKSGNCFIALEMAGNMGISPIFLMQNMAVVHGKPTLEAKIITAMVNSSGRFAEPLEYEIKGTDPAYDAKVKAPKDRTYRVRAYAKRRSDGKVLYGPWIDWDMVEGEGWVQKEGSKWKTMPEMMFMYRAASYFSKVHCTDITFGMQSTEEMMDVIDVSPGTGANGTPTRVARAGKILSGFDDDDAEVPSAAGPAAGATKVEEGESISNFAADPATCKHPLDTMEDLAEGEAICSLCGTEFTIEEGAPSISEQKAIKAQELKDAGGQQGTMFTD